MSERKSTIVIARKPASRTQKQLAVENEELRSRVAAAEEILRAIRTGKVDAILVSGADGDQIFTLKQAEDALQESEARTSKLIEHLPTVVYMNAVSDVSSTLYVSPQIETLLEHVMNL